MKRIILFTILCGLAFQGFSIVPSYYGARSLSLGYGSTAFNYDINSMFLNPSILAGMNLSMSGYQYQNSFMEYKDFSGQLDEVLSYNLTNFEGLSAADKTEAFAKLADLYDAKYGMFGFIGNVPGYTAKGYGMSFGVYSTAVINPVNPAGTEENPGIDIFNKPVEEVTNADIASLQMNIMGLKYKQISVSYGMDAAQSISIGVTLHYLYGKMEQANRSLLDATFSPGTSVKSYLQSGWDNLETKFTKIVMDAGVTMTLGRHFKAGVSARNFGGAKLTYGESKIELPKRFIAGLAFRPDASWGIYMDMDIKKSDLLFNGQEIQPVSIGVEKGFFNNKFFIRAGMLNDITEKHFFGKKGNALYGFGIGFNMSKIVVDLAIGINNDGSVKNLAISGFFIVK